MHNPNFPPELSINPSSNPFSTNAHSRHERDEDAASAFNFSAQQSAIQKYGIAGRVWEASYTLTRYLQNQHDFDPPSPFCPPAVYATTACLSEHTNASSEQEPPFSVLELGSGTGAVAANLSAVLSSECALDVPSDIDRAIRPPATSSHLIIATDLEDVCPLLETNLIAPLSAGSSGECDRPEILVRPLGWGNQEHAQAIFKELSQSKRRLTHILCSDLVYFPELLAPLLRSLIQLTSSPPMDCAQNGHEKLTIIISYKVRSLAKESPFWSAFGLWFDWEPVLYRTSSTDHNSATLSGPWTRYHSPSSTYLFTARRKPTSHSWSVPESDIDLLKGVGANGNDLRKGDDGFEIMLLMDMIDLDDV